MKKKVCELVVGDMVSTVDMGHFSPLSVTFYSREVVAIEAVSSRLTLVTFSDRSTEKWMSDATVEYTPSLRTDFADAPAQPLTISAFLTPLARKLGITFAAPRAGDAGYDLYACIEEPVNIESGMIAKIPTGIHVAIPDGYVGKISDRSSMASKGMVMLGGVIDASFRGEPHILVLNTNNFDVIVNPKTKAAQMLILPYLSRPVSIVDDVSELGETERGHNGFGSTGR